MVGSIELKCSVSERGDNVKTISQIQIRLASISVIPASSSVIPAKAGIHTFERWIPAFAGMTVRD